MDQRPRHAKARGVNRSMLLRSWGYLGVISALLVLLGFFFTLSRGGWHLHAATGAGSPFHLVYAQATTVAWLGIVACQIGTAFAVRTDRLSLRSIGLFSNRALLGGIAFALVFAFALVYAPPFHRIFGTASLSASQLVVLLPFPLIVWGADEIRRAIQRHSGARPLSD